MTEEPGPDQLELIGPRGGLLPRPPKRRGNALASTLPIAQVVLETPLARLDRVFEYEVPDRLDPQVVFGVKVGVRLGPQRMTGWVVGRTPEASHAGALRRLDAVLAPEPQLTPETLALCRAVADHYLGTLSDVLRLALPPRHAAAAATPLVQTSMPTAPASDVLAPGPGRWVWTCPPGTDWAAAFADALTAAAAAGGRGLAVLPDARDVARLAGELAKRVGAGGFAVLTAQESAADRYRGFAAALVGSVALVIGTRSAAFAPLSEPDLLLLWDDGDDSHAERRAPYPHAREVLGLRSTSANTFIVAGYGRSTNTQRWLEIGWAAALGPLVRDRRAASLRVHVTDDDSGWATPPERAARIPPAAGAAIRRGLETGPVLVCVARPGYLPRLCCQSCRAPADCPTCGGALAITSGHAVPSCARCGRLAGDWRCPECQGRTFRSVAVGGGRTAEELGRAYPGTRVVLSAGDRIIHTLPDQPALVVATPGAEPHTPAGYSAVVVLDVAAALAQPGLRSGEQAVRRWFNAGGLARPGAPMVIVASPDLPAVQALVRGDPGWFATRELQERRAAGMPPGHKVVTLAGESKDLADLTADLPPSVSVLGPVPSADGEGERVLLSIAHREGPQVVELLRSRLAARSSQGAGPLVVQVDPIDLA